MSDQVKLLTASVCKSDSHADVVLCTVLEKQISCETPFLCCLQMLHVHKLLATDKSLLQLALPDR